MLQNISFIRDIYFFHDPLPYRYITPELGVNWH